MPFISALRTLVPTYRHVLFTLFLLALAVVFAVSYVSRERYIYFWDMSTYFTYFAELGEKVIVSPLKAIDSVFISIRKADYNTTGVVPLLPFYYVFGPGRASFISAIAVIYVLPIIIFFPLLLRTVWGRIGISDEERDGSLFVLLTLSMALLPQLWVPVFLGYIDVAGVLIIFVILWLYFRKEFTQQTTRGLMALGSLLSLLVIVRRWYAYWVIGFFAAVAVHQAIKIAESSDTVPAIKLFLRNILITGLTAALTFFALATQISIRMLTTDYSDIYSAAKSPEGLPKQIAKFADHLGWFVLVLIAAGVVTGIAVRSTRKQAIFTVVLFTVTFITFSKTQDLDFHHYNGVIPAMMIFVGLLLRQIYARLNGRLLRAGAVIAFVFVLTINFAIVFVPHLDTAISPISLIFPSTRLYPKVRTDLDEVHSLMTALDSEINGSDSKVYVLSSSLSLNSGVVYSACYAFEPQLRQLRKNILLSNDVDKRDGFPFQMYTADLIVVADPPGYHLRPDDQRVIGLLAQDILSGDLIGSAFARLPYEFTLEDGRHVYIYRKNRKFNAEELTKTSDIFVDLYPEHRKQFEIDAVKLEQFTR